VVGANLHERVTTWCYGDFGDVPFLKTTRGSHPCWGRTEAGLDPGPLNFIENSFTDTEKLPKPYLASKLQILLIWHCLKFLFPN